MISLERSSLYDRRIECPKVHKVRLEDATTVERAVSLATDTPCIYHNVYHGVRGDKLAGFRQGCHCSGWPAYLFMYREGKRFRKWASIDLLTDRRPSDDIANVLESLASGVVRTTTEEALNITDYECPTR